MNHFGTETPAQNPLFLVWEAETDEKSSFAESSGEHLLDTDRLSNQTRSGNAGGSSPESDTAQGCDPDDVDFRACSMSPGRQRFFVVRAQNAFRCRADDEDSTWRHV